MKALIKTADGLESLIDIYSFQLEIRRPIIRKFDYYDEYNPNPVLGIRIYSYVNTRQSDDTPIYEEVIFEEKDK